MFKWIDKDASDWRLELQQIGISKCSNGGQFETGVLKLTLI